AGWVADALFRPETREAYRQLLAQGWTDTLRHLHPAGRVYTFWEYTRGAWGRNLGLRIDHLLLNPAAARRLAGAGVDRDVRGWEKTSDTPPPGSNFATPSAGHGRAPGISAPGIGCRAPPLRVRPGRVRVGPR